MKKRVISAAVAILLLILVLYFQGIILYVAAGLLAILAYRELTNLKVLKNIPLTNKGLGVIAVLLLVYSLFDGYSIAFGISYKMVAVASLLTFIPVLFSKDKYGALEAIYHFGIIIFLGLVFNLLILVINLNVKMFLYLILITILTDTFALFIGKLIGKHKFFPSISPNKTIEGAIGGSVVGTIIASIFYINLIGNVNIFIAILITLLFSMIGQAGDLIFSKIKRENGIKDFSNIMPGHGGILDRLDSIIFVLLTYILFFTIL